MDDTVVCLEEIAALGARFALSPINPTGFIKECHRLGLLAVPSALSSNEMWEMHRQGVQMIKMFHAGVVTAKCLKSMKGVSPFGNALSIMPSGGVSPENAPEWLDAGCLWAGEEEGRCLPTAMRWERKSKPMFKANGQKFS